MNTQVDRRGPERKGKTRILKNDPKVVRTSPKLRATTEKMIAKIEQKHAEFLEALGRSKRKIRANANLDKRLGKSEDQNRLLIEYLLQAASLLNQLLDGYEKSVKTQNLERIILTGLFHDLKNIMAIISSSAQFCLETVHGKSKIRDNLLMILNSNRKAAGMIEKYRLYAKSLAWDYRPIDINRLVLDSWSLARSAIPGGRISFRADLGKNLPKAFGSYENLRRVFFNLFLNAIQAIGKKGKVRVRTELLSSKDMLGIEVIDDGPGIQKEYRKKIFAPYFSTKKGGEGIGLYISDLIVKEHQGLIEIDSGGEKGAKVKVRLPRMSYFKNHASSEFRGFQKTADEKDGEPSPRS